MANYFGLSFFVLSHRGMVEHTVSGNLISANWDLPVWACGIFVVIAWLFHLVSRNGGGFYRIFADLVLFGLTCWVSLVVFGVASVVSLVLVSLLLFSMALVFSVFFFGVSMPGLFLRFLLGCILVVLSVEVTDLVLFNAPVALNIGHGIAGLHWNNVELSFSNLAYPFLSYVYLFLVFSGVVAFVVKSLPTGWFSKIKGRRFVTFLGRLGGSFKVSSDSGFEFHRGRFVLVAVVFAGAIISCLFVVFTVLPWSNPTNMLVSADSPTYYHFIVYMRSVNVNSALSSAFADDHALFLVLGYALSFFASPLVVIQFVAALLTVISGIVTLFVLRLFSSFRTVWVLGILLLPFSFQSLGLIYSGYFANMLALILVFVYVVLFFKILNSWSKFSFLWFVDRFCSYSAFSPMDLVYFCTITCGFFVLGVAYSCE